MSTDSTTPPDFVTAAAKLYVAGYGLQQEEGREGIYSLYNRKEKTTQTIAAGNFQEATLKAWEMVQKETTNEQKTKR